MKGCSSAPILSYLTSFYPTQLCCSESDNLSNSRVTEIWKSCSIIHLIADKPWDIVARHHLRPEYSIISFLFDIHYWGNIRNIIFTFKHRIISANNYPMPVTVYNSISSCIKQNKGKKNLIMTKVNTVPGSTIQLQVGDEMAWKYRSSSSQVLAQFMSWKQSPVVLICAALLCPGAPPVF